MPHVRAPLHEHKVPRLVKLADLLGLEVLGLGALRGDGRGGALRGGLGGLAEIHRAGR